MCSWTKTLTFLARVSNITGSTSVQACPIYMVAKLVVFTVSACTIAFVSKSSILTNYICKTTRYYFRQKVIFYLQWLSNCFVNLMENWKAVVDNIVSNLTWVTQISTIPVLTSDQTWSIDFVAFILITTVPTYFSAAMSKCTIVACFCKI